MFRRFVVALALLCGTIFGGASQAHAQTTTVRVGFEGGFVAEYTNNAHQPTRLQTFSTLGIKAAEISQQSDNGQFGGSQGNDYSVTVTLQFTDGSTRTFPAAVNWRDTQGSTIHGIGLTVSDGTVDGTSYVATSGKHVTYLLQFVGSTRAYQDTALNQTSGVVSGNAATSGLLAALNTYLAATPASTTPSALTSTISAADPSISADGSSTTLITVQLKDVNGNLITSGGATVTLSTNAGALSSVVDLGNGTYTAILTSSASPASATITGSVNSAPISGTATVDFITAPSGGTISGTLTKGGHAVSGETIRLVDSNSQIVATTTTDSLGNYSFTNVADGVYSIEFTTARTRAHSSSGANSGSTVTGITVSGASSVAQVDAIVLDPSGVVYDSDTRAPLSGATVSLWFGGSKVSSSWLDTGLGGDNDQVTGADGAYSFILNASASSGTYELRVSAPTGFDDTESAAIPASGTYTPALGGGVEMIQPQSTAPTGSDDTTYYLFFNFTIGSDLASTSNGVIHNHIPLDAAATPIAFTGATGTASGGGSAYAFDYDENSAADTLLGTVAATGGNGSALTFSITAGNSNGWFAIDASTGEISITATGAASLANDYETATNNHVLTVQATDGATTASIETQLNESDVIESIAFTGATGTASGGGPAYAFDYNENSAADTILGTVAATGGNGSAITFSITAGNSNGWFAIDASTGEITITATGAASLANDFEAATNNHVLTVQATDGAAVATIELQLNELDALDTPPVITGPSGGAGAAASQITINENQTAIVTMAADKTVAWSLSGGEDAGAFAIDPTTGALTFLAAPDYEAPSDGATSGTNSYIVIVVATDSNTQTSSQTVTVYIADVIEAGPQIQGPSGAPGASLSEISIPEGQSLVTQFTADVSVAWSINGGEDASLFAIAADGTLRFLTAPDYENPTDAQGDNVYIVEVQAIDGSSQSSIQTIRITVLNLDELAAKIDEISDELRGGLRAYAFNGLLDMLSFNESMLSENGDAWVCEQSARRLPFSGELNADERQQQGALNYENRLTPCNARYALRLSLGATISRSHGDSTRRTYGALRLDRRISDDTMIGLIVLGSWSENGLQGFSSGHVSDHALQVSAYGRKNLTDRLRIGAFAGLGRSRYEFSLADDGLSLDGDMTGERVVYGGMLSGDIDIGGTTVTTDVVLSHARESLGDASIDAEYMGESASGLRFNVGNVDATRLSVPAHISFTLINPGQPSDNSLRLTLSPGLLCEDASSQSHTIQCGHQIAGALEYDGNSGAHLQARLHHEAIDEITRDLVSIQVTRRFGPRDMIETGLSMEQSFDTMSPGPDFHFMLSLKPE